MSAPGRLPSRLPARQAGRRRDRHGRGLRGPLIPPYLPGYRDRAGQFDDMVLEAIEFAERAGGQLLDGFEIAVEEVPPFDPAAWEPGVRLGRYFPARAPLPARIVLFRMPIASRAADENELRLLIRRVLVEQVAAATGRSPRDIDPRYFDR